MPRCQTIPSSAISLRAGLVLTILLAAWSARADAQVPAAWDWRDVDGHDLVLPPKNIGSCSSSYLAIPVAMVESRSLVAAYRQGVVAPPVAYSVQYLLSCGSGYFGDFGCAGGYAKDPLTWIRDTGIPRAACYEYRAVDEDCPAVCPDTGEPLNLERPVAEVYEDQAYPAPDLLQEMIWQDGPIAVSMDLYDDFSTYYQGIYEHVTGSYVTSFIVLVVGWGSEGGQDYWICQNCWGTWWGEDGYVRIARDASLAGCNFGAWAWWCSIGSAASPVPPTPAAAAVVGCRPNPCNPLTTVTYRTPVDGPAVLAVYDLAGRLVRALADGDHLGGCEYQVPWDGRDDRGAALASGVYLARLVTPGGAATARMVLLK